MNYKYIFLLFTLTFVYSCKSLKNNNSDISKTRVEKIEYVNYLGEKEDHYGVFTEKSYYENNKLMAIKYFDKNGELIKSIEKDKNSQWQFFYDKNGNFTKQVALDQEGNIIDMEGFWNSAVEKYTYNEKNQLIEKGNYDKEDNLLNMGDIQVAFTKFGYNKKGQLTWSRSYDSKKNVVKNGFCFSKYEYDKNGLLYRHTYLYDDDKVNQYSIFHYKAGLLIKEEVYDNKNRKSTCKEYFYDGDRLTSTKSLYRKGEQPVYNKEYIILDLEGWSIKKSDLKKLKFKKSGKGAFNIEINEHGEIVNVEPIEFRGHKFKVELYKILKNIQLQKVSNEKNYTLEGKFKINILSQEKGIIDEIERRLNPIPYNFY